MESMTLVAAINDKYSVNQSDLQSYVKFGGDDISKAKGYFNKIPESVTLQQYGINSIGEVDELKKLCQRLKTLDVHGNQFESWDDVLPILKCLPFLEVLNVSQNPLIGRVPDSQDFVASKVKVLILNNVNISWKEISPLQKYLQCLEELHFSLTDKSNINPEEAGEWSSVKCLHCSNSQLSTSKDLLSLGKVFPNLQRLTIVENPISDFGEDIENSFQELKCLNVSKTGYCDWKELEKLRKLPNLCDLRIKGIPLMSDVKEKQRRQHTVARLPMITTLNGSSVTESERELAERAFLRFYLPIDDKPSRFFELHEVHSDIKPLVDIDLAPVNYVTCLIKYEGKQEMRKIYLKMTVIEFKKSLVEFVGLPLKDFSLFHNDCLTEHSLQQLIIGKRCLFSFVHDGDEFVCQKTNKTYFSLANFKSRNLKS